MEILFLVLVAIGVIDGVVGIVSFEQPVYDVLEDIGLNDRALRVCLLASENTVVNVVTESLTADVGT